MTRPTTKHAIIAQGVLTLQSVDSLPSLANHVHKPRPSVAIKVTQRMCVISIRVIMLLEVHE